MTVYTDLNQVDVAIFDIDRTREPWSVHCEARVGGRLDAERLAAAALEAARHHPLARAWLASYRRRDSGLRWAIDEQISAIPIEIATCSDEQDIETLRARLMSRRVDLDTAPTFALGLAHRPGGDHLIINLSHVAGDGMSAYRLMTSIARAYSSTPDPAAPVDPLAVRDVRRLVGSRSSKDIATRLRKLGGMISQTITDGAPARVAVSGGDDDLTGFGFRLLHFTTPETERIAARRRKPATVNDLLLAALALTIRRFNDAHGAPTGRVSMMMPINLRPPQWSREVVSNIVSYVPVVLGSADQHELGPAQAAVAAETATLKRQRQSGTLVDITALTGRLPTGVRNAVVATTRDALVNSALDTAVLSNLGNLSEPVQFGPDAGVATELWFSPPASMPLGVAVGACTMNAQLFLTLRYCRAQFDQAGAAEFEHMLRETLLPPT